MKVFRRILHPTDFSPASRPAFAKALDLARQNGAELWLVHVLASPAPLAGEGYIPPETYERLEASARKEAQTRLATLVARAKRAGARARTVLLQGGAHEQIARAARSKRADLIVVGTHGRTGLSRFFIGSVAERVIRLAPCAVLTVRGK